MTYDPLTFQYKNADILFDGIARKTCGDADLKFVLPLTAELYYVREFTLQRNFGGHFAAKTVVRLPRNQVGRLKQKLVVTLRGISTAACVLDTHFVGTDINRSIAAKRHVDRIVTNPLWKTLSKYAV